MENTSFIYKLLSLAVSILFFFVSKKYLIKPEKTNEVKLCLRWISIQSILMSLSAVFSLADYYGKPLCFLSIVYLFCVVQDGRIKRELEEKAQKRAELDKKLERDKAKKAWMSKYGCPAGLYCEQMGGNKTYCHNLHICIEIPFRGEINVNPG